MGDPHDQVQLFRTTGANVRQTGGGDETGPGAARTPDEPADRIAADRDRVDDAAAADKVASEATTAPPDVAVSAGVELNSESATPSVLGGREDV